MLQYALLHLFGYKVTLDDLKAFRVGGLPKIIRLFLRSDTPRKSLSIASHQATRKLRILLVSRLPLDLSVKVSQMLSALPLLRPRRPLRSISQVSI